MEEEKDFMDDAPIIKKKQLSEQKLQHLANIRIKALEKKKEMKEITEKANKLKEIGTLKQAKPDQKEKLAQQYAEMITKEKQEREKENIPPKEEQKEEIKPKEEPPKPKKQKIIKKVIYQEASSSDSDDADEVEIVKVKKPSKQKPQQQQEPQQQQVKPPVNNSYSNLLYESSIDKLKSRMMEDRAKYLISSIMPSYG
jgi:hypothetical protein